MRRLKTVLRWVFALFFILAGVNHFRDPGFYVSIMPPYLPWHLELVYISGVAEIVLGVMLLFRRWKLVYISGVAEIALDVSVLAAWGLIALLLAVFPANVHMAMHSELYPSAPPIGLWLRLPLQFVLVAWAYWYTRPDPTQAPAA